MLVLLFLETVMLVLMIVYVVVESVLMILMDDRMRAVQCGGLWFDNR